MHTLQFSQWLASLLLFLIGYYFWRSLFTTGYRHPPGPRGLPVIGNTHQAPRPFSWKWYEQLRNAYGQMFRLSVLGDNFIILNSPKIAEELLGRRSINYSSRKILPFAGYHRSGNRRMILMQYNEQFKRQRTAMQLLFRPEGMASNRARQQQQAIKLLLDLLTTPEKYAVHLKTYSGGIALGVAFGMTLEEAEIETPHMMANTERIGADLFPGLWMADMFPWLDKIPAFLAGWKAKALTIHRHELSVFKHFASYAKAINPDTLLAKPLVASLWDSQDSLGLDDKSILYVCGSVGEAGTNTTACALHCFLLACTTRPDVVKKAQDELDSVIGNRPPRFSDFIDLPYVYAVVKEVLRWIPVTPLSFPHLASDDDEFDGFYIPRGSLMVASIWNMHRDPHIFADPAVFEPMRWYAPTPDRKVDKETSLFDGIWTFGFGRRACPGQRLAVDSVWIGVAHLLWGFNIIDKDPYAASQRSTEMVDANLTWRDAVNIEPRILDIVITPRSEEINHKILEEWEVLNTRG